MEWNGNHAYTIVIRRLPWCAHAHKLDNRKFSAHTKEEADDGSTDGRGDRAGGLAVCTL